MKSFVTEESIQVQIKLVVLWRLINIIEITSKVAFQVGINSKGEEKVEQKLSSNTTNVV